MCLVEKVVYRPHTDTHVRECRCTYIGVIVGEVNRRYIIINIMSIQSTKTDGPCVAAAAAVVECSSLSYGHGIRNPHVYLRYIIIIL